PPASLPTHNMHFFAVAAKSLDGWRSEYIQTSVPAFKKWLNHSRVGILRMDCAGCEYALARDVAVEDPMFFENVDQFSIKLHLDRLHMTTRTHLHHLALLFYMLRVSGLELVHAVIDGLCREVVDGCWPELVAAGYPCSAGSMCQNLLFVRNGGRLE
ncbi:hypothetical protein HK104_004162, partial [Borealophlyctis nickersoniae]